MARLVDQFREALAAFSGAGTTPALIGGLALAAYQVIRATQDIDFLVASEDADRIHVALAGLGYTCIHRSQDAANYVRGDEGLDLLYAHRFIARQLLEGAQARDTSLGRVRVVSPEGLIAFKLQAWVNDPSRTRDLEDIKSLLRARAGTLDLDELAGYFRMFEREALLDELITQAGIRPA